jgi:hypothetical protein
MIITVKIPVKWLHGQKWYEQAHEKWEEKLIDISGIVCMCRNERNPKEIRIRQSRPWSPYTTNYEGYIKVLARLLEAGISIDSDKFKLEGE